MKGDFIYVRFTRWSLGFKPGDIVKCKLSERHNMGIRVIFDSSPSNLLPLSVWSDLSGFEEIPAMELLALAADGRLNL